jgi:hypothetical protein
VARNRSGGVNNSRNRIENLAPRRKLQDEEIIAGIGYDSTQGRIKKHQKHNNNMYSNTGSTNDETDKENKANSDIEKEELQRAEQELPCWFIPRLGNMQQDRPEGVFCLLGGNLNSASSRDVQNRKISDIIMVIKGMYRLGASRRLASSGRMCRAQSR